MPNQILCVHPDDDMVVALVDQPNGKSVRVSSASIVLQDDIPAKHKFARRSIAQGDRLRMYGITVGRAIRDILIGELITIGNLTHATDDIAENRKILPWQPPDISHCSDLTFDGYHRADGRVGTRNFWIFCPLVFCQNRNLDVLRQALVEELGYGNMSGYHRLARQLISQLQSGASAEEIRTNPLDPAPVAPSPSRVFPNVDGIKFLRHELGCGGNYQDAIDLCGLLAGYINHPNVAGATVLSLGCQKSQVEDLQQALTARNPDFEKPLLIFEQQQIQSEQAMIRTAIRETLAALVEANNIQRRAAPASRLNLGVECGASDGFSGLSANPAIGHCSDLLVALGGTVILSEFPELAGCEQELADRCLSQPIADRFLNMMRDYEAKARMVGASFATNPSPGNIRDGLITDAMKSAGAAKKGGTSPIVDVLDYPGPVTKPGLNLLCTPGADVESTTAKAGCGANIQFFSTGLGTPTGNPITPVIKISTNSHLATTMPDIIDLDAGPIISGQQTIEDIGWLLLQKMIRVASGEFTKAELLGQEDFMPWKRGISF